MSAKGYWDNHAMRWDAIYLDESPLARRVNLVLRKAIYERFHIALEAPGDFTNKTVLDVGCGSGRFAIEAARRGASRAVGLDFAPNMLEIARSHAAAAEVASRCEFVQGDFMEFGIDETFDVVVANGFFDYMANPEAVLRRMAQLTRAVLVASFPGRSPIRNFLRRMRYQLQGCPVFFYTEADVRRLANAAGLPNYTLHYMDHSGTGFMLVGSMQRQAPEPETSRTNREPRAGLLK